MSQIMVLCQTQEKFLTANSTQNGGVLADLTFNNLVIGRTYVCRLKATMKAGDALFQQISIVHNGVTLDICFNRAESGSAGAGGSFYGEATFVATATTLTFVPSGASAGRLMYGGVGGYTKAILEEYNTYQILTTTRFT
jgi:hypothetical protein